MHWTAACGRSSTGLPRSPSRRARMRASLALLALLATAPTAAQPPARNAQVDSMLAAISATRIEARIRKLVSFRTRHTLSRTDSDTQGIGAARRWIKAELEQCSRDAGGRLGVELDSFIQQPARRVPRPVEIVNIVATLPGTQPQAANRIYVVSGHYDSMPGDVMDPQSEAPGANDDASGTAVAMELACVMAYQRFDATLVFMAVGRGGEGPPCSPPLGPPARSKRGDVARTGTHETIGPPPRAGGRGHAGANRGPAK